MKESIRPALVLLLMLTLITGVLYPFAVTGLAFAIFPAQAEGSLITRGARIIGSELIGQQFTSPAYFHSRPSAAGNGYDPMASGGSNLGPTSATLKRRVDSLVKTLGAENPGVAIPVELVTTSGSGLDPHLSPAGATFQIPRVARARGIAPDVLSSLVSRCTEGRQFGILGEPVVSVMLLNLALDSLTAHR